MMVTFAFLSMLLRKNWYFNISIESFNSAGRKKGETLLGLNSICPTYTSLGKGEESL